MTTRVALYARYSSERQNERSIADQLAVLSRHCEARGWSVVGVFSDAAISGAALANRPGLLSAVGAAERGEYDVLLAEDQDRFARNLEHQAHVFNRLKRLGIRLATLSTDSVTLVDTALRGLMAELFLDNLSQKTRRGMHSNAEKGLATGSRTFGYRSAPGGAMAIVEAEAEVVRRVFRRWVEGASCRQIAAELNADGVHAPRGGAWNASVVHGNPKRGSGLLNCELYAGVKVWNRIEMSKDPLTGARISRPRPHAEWRRTPTPELAILDPDTWARARARKAAEAKVTPAALALRRKPGLFSGLWKCGRCGASYTVLTGEKLGCAAAREKGAAVCGNTRTIRRGEAEAVVLEGLRDRLLAPDLVATYVRAYHKAWLEERERDLAARAPLERRRGELGRAVGRIVDAIAEGSASKAMAAKLAALEAELETVEADLSAAAAQGADAPPQAPHPKFAEAYREKIAELHRRLAASARGGNDAPRDLADAARALIDRIEVRPRTQARGGPVDLMLHGRLERFLIQDREPLENRSMNLMVAGGRIHQIPPAPPLKLPLRPARSAA